MTKAVDRLVARVLDEKISPREIVAQIAVFSIKAAASDRLRFLFGSSEDLVNGNCFPPYEDAVMLMNHAEDKELEINDVCERLCCDRDQAVQIIRSTHNFSRKIADNTPEGGRYRLWGYNVRLLGVIQGSDAIVGSAKHDVLFHAVGAYVMQGMRRAHKNPYAKNINTSEMRLREELLQSTADKVYLRILDGN